MNKAVAIVTLNWNNSRDSLLCLESLFQLDWENYAVIFVDNGSSDDSVQVVAKAYPEVTILALEENQGYAGGNNAGIRYALQHGYDYVFIVNNDIVVSANTLQKLVDAMESRERCGIASPLVADDGADKAVWALGSTIEASSAKVLRNHAGEPLERWLGHPSFEVDAASGAAMLVRRKTFQEIGLMDEDFFLYYEEIDWCLTARKEGVQILAVPEALVRHKVSATLGASSPIIDYYMLRNHLRLINHHWSGWQRPMLLARVVLRSIVTIAAYTFKSQDGRRTPSRNARLLALRDAVLGRWGKMGPDVAAKCSRQQGRTDPTV